MLFGLPGNPVAVMVVFYALIRDALLRLAGARPRPLPTLACFATAALTKRPERTEFIRVTIERDGEGRPLARPTGAQGSAILHSMSEADGLMILGPGLSSLAAGDRVEVLPLRGLV